MDNKLSLSVHQLVDFLLRKGNIDNRIYNRSSMLEGTRMHSFYQSNQSKGYISEYPLQVYQMVDGIEFHIHGRADGIINKNGKYTIDEIKTTVTDLMEYRDSQIDWHLGQAKCYAYMFAKEQNLDYIGVKLTYLRQGKTKDKLVDEYYFNYNELEMFFIQLLEEYLSFYNLILEHISNRTKSIQNLEFPFKKYRAGQKELAKYVYSNSLKGGSLFVEAPTGIGKTMSTLFPNIKILEKNEKSKIFYLTAKSSGKESAMNAVATLKEKGLILNNILITAKEKICFCKGKSCNPDECPYAKGYYDKISRALRMALLSNTTFDYETIIDIAYNHDICPFEFELDLSLFCDVIICDYNYLYDPISYMKRYFDEDASEYIALVDEAHNLLSRSRDMYSASISYKDAIKAKKELKGTHNAKARRALLKVIDMMEPFMELEKGEYEYSNFDDETYKTLEKFILKIQELTKDDFKLKGIFKDFYLDVNEFLKISDFVNEKYLIYVEKNEDDCIMHLFCMDPSSFLRMDNEKLKSSVFFSATLSPINYYIDTLGGEKNSPSLLLSSPFPKENLLLLVAPKVSIKYKNRNESYSTVKEYIENFIQGKIGNYFIYCPSYEYMDKIVSLIDIPNVDIFVQSKDMDEVQKGQFLDNFKSNPEKTTLGFLVIGGAFSEGIDLVNDRLIGAVIIGVGLSKINYQSDKISEYYKNLDLNGYEYSYLNPGMNKVMQAVGRVIRGEKERGAVLLIDERYTYKNYQSLYRREWNHYQLVFSPEDIKKKVSNFFIK